LSALAQQNDIIEFPEKLGCLFEPHRYKVAHGGRGGCKSWSFARALLLEGAEKPIRILCCREVQKSIKDSVHKLLSDQIDALGLGGFYEVLANEIKGRNGTEFAFTGLSNQTSYSIKSFENFQYAWVEEAHQVSRKSWDILIPTIRADGSEIWISLNPELDTDETYQRFVADPPESAKVIEINYDDNPWFPAVLEEERLHMLRQVDKGARDRDDYDNIWEGKTKVVIDGAIFAKELTELKRSKRLCRVPYDPMLKVHCIYDLGWADSTAILMVQKSASEVRVIDYIEDTHRTIDDYLISGEGREDLESRKYRWGTDFLPHDGRSRSVLSKKSAEDILRGLGREVEITPEIGIENGIKALRMLLPRMVIDEEKAGLLFNRLSRYKRRINQTTGQPGSPEHDENSHGSDGARYLAVVEDRLVNEDADLGDYYAEYNNG
jgi:phage terminase large subunit